MVVKKTTQSKPSSSSKVKVKPKKSSSSTKTKVKPSSSTKTKVNSQSKSSIKVNSPSKSSSKTLINSPSKSSSKVFIVKQKQSKNYLDYIKQNKYKFITSGLVTLGALSYIRYNKNQGKELINKIKKDKELQDVVSSMGSQVIIKVINNYVGDTLKNINNALNLNENNKKNIRNIGNKLGDILENPVQSAQNTVESVQNAIATTMVPQELIDNPIVLDKINTIIVKNVEETLIPRNIIDSIEKYLINKGIIDSNCSKYNSLVGSFPCEDDKKKKTYEEVLKYYSDENLLKDVNEYIKQILLQEAEKFLLNEKKIQDGCTKYNKAYYFFSTPCIDQKEADKLIQDKLNELMKK